MPKLTIDNKEYEIEDLSNDAKAQIMSIQFVDSEIGQTNLRLAALQTARNAYAKALKSLLESGDETNEEVSIEGLGDTLKFE